MIKSDIKLSKKPKCCKKNNFKNTLRWFLLKRHQKNCIILSKCTKILICTLLDTAVYKNSNGIKYKDLFNIISCHYSLSLGVLKDWVYQVKNSTINFRKLKNQQISVRMFLWPFTCKHFQLYITCYSFLCPDATLLFSLKPKSGKTCYLTAFSLLIDTSKD